MIVGPASVNVITVLSLLTLSTIGVERLEKRGFGTNVTLRTGKRRDFEGGYSGLISGLWEGLRLHVQESILGGKDEYGGTRRLEKKYILIVIVVLAAFFAILSVIYYMRMHNTFITSIVFADDKILASDGGGPYKENEANMHMGPLDPQYAPNTYIVNMNYTSRSVKVSFAQTQWKDGNLMNMTSRLPSKNYRLYVMYWVSSGGEFEDIYNKMDVGARYAPPQLCAFIFLYDADTGALAGYFFSPIGPSNMDIFGNNRWINTTVPEPPQSLRDDGHIYLTRVSDEQWVLDVDTWYLAYYFPPNGSMWKYYIKLSFVMIINRNRAM
jgi:hypothetical protein